MFLMIPEYTIQRYDKRRARKDFAKINEQFKNILNSFSDNELANEILSLDNEDFNRFFEDNKERYLLDKPIIRKVKYNPNLNPSEQSREARNNMLIDISTGILRSKDTAFKICNPGNFDKLKKASYITIISTDINLSIKYLQSYGYTDVNSSNIAELNSLLNDLLLKDDLSSLKDFIEESKTERSPLSLDTFIYNHNQNMTGGALIGMYANNTTMQSKYQNTKLGIKEDNAFYINNKKISSLHDIYNAEGELISLNCAQASAASVDNVKDPVLANLMQNMSTAGIAGFMLRAGMTVEEVGLLFSQPIIRETILRDGNLYKLQSVINDYITVINKNYGSVNIDLKTYNPSSENLLNNITSYTVNNSLRDDTGMLMLNDITLPILIENVRSANLVLHISNLAGILSELTKISRADSPNGAIDITIAGAKTQVRRVEVYHRMSKLKSFPLTGIEGVHKNDIVNPDMSINELREIFNRQPMPMLQAFYSLGVEFGTKLLSKNIDIVNEYTDAIYDRLCNLSKDGVIPDTVAKSMYKDLMSYYLSSTTLFGNDSNNTYEKKRDYYLNKFPEVFQQIKADNPDIASLGIISKLEVNNGTIEFKRSGRLTPLSIESFMIDMDTLLYMPNSEAQRLAIDLFMYSYYKEGFAFGPNSYGNFFSSNFLNAFPEYINALRTMKDSLKYKEFTDNFFDQFVNNNLSIIPNISLSVNDFSDLGDGRLAIKTNAVINKLNDQNPYEYINLGSIFETRIYKLQSTASGSCIYTFVKDVNIPYYNANKSLDELIEEFAQPEENSTKTVVPEKNTSILSDQEVISKMENMIGDNVGGLMNLIDQLESSSIKEMYSEEEGNAQLKDELC